MASIKGRIFVHNRKCTAFLVDLEIESLSIISEINEAEILVIGQAKEIIIDCNCLVDLSFALNGRTYFLFCIEIIHDKVVPKGVYHLGPSFQSNSCIYIFLFD